jgi:hypothetical protein
MAERPAVIGLTGERRGELAASGLRLSAEDHTFSQRQPRAGGLLNGLSSELGQSMADESTCVDATFSER